MSMPKFESIINSFARQIGVKQYICANRTEKGYRAKVQGYLFAGNAQSQTIYVKASNSRNWMPLKGVC